MTDGGRPVIRRLTSEHAADYRALMLQAYALHPDAFASSVTEREILPLSWWEDRLTGEPDPPQVVLGLFEGGALGGVAGLAFHAREKERHKAALFGMYMASRCRGRGLGGRLLDAAMACARARKGLRLVQLTVTQGNAGALALYEKAGFRTFGIEPDAVAVGGRFLGKVHMCCHLHMPDGRPPAASSEAFVAGSGVSSPD
jgi:ribosomal protein S18 acetylase RimI-like enzyme